MTGETFEPATGQRKRNLTEKARLAAESQPRKRAKVSEGSQTTKGTGTASTAKSSASRKRMVSIEDIEDEDDLRRSPPPHNPNHILEGPDDDDDDNDDKIVKPQLKTKAKLHKRMVSIEEIEDEDDLRRSPPPRNPNHILEGPDDDDDNDEIVKPQPKTKAKPTMKGTGVTASTAKSSASRKRTVSIEEIDDEEDLRQSPPPRNPNHILEGPGDNDERNPDVIEVHSNVPEKPAESAEAELSELNVVVLISAGLTFLCRAALQKMDVSYLCLLSPYSPHRVC